MGQILRQGPRRQAPEPVPATTRGVGHVKRAQPRREGPDTRADPSLLARRPAGPSVPRRCRDGPARSELRPYHVVGPPRSPGLEHRERRLLGAPAGHGQHQPVRPGVQVSLARPADRTETRRRATEGSRGDRRTRGAAGRSGGPGRIGAGSGAPACALPHRQQRRHRPLPAPVLVLAPGATFARGEHPLDPPAAVELAARVP